MSNKPFDITKPFHTRDGSKVEIISDKGRGEYPIVGYIGDVFRTLDTWTLDGIFSKAGYMPGNDLVNTKEKKLVPLEASDIKPNYLFRRQGPSTVNLWSIVTALHKGKVFLSPSNPDGWTFQELRDNYLISRDGGNTWENCEKEIEE